jgi:hypothetical protein
LEYGSLLPLFPRKAGRCKSGRGPPHSKTLPRTSPTPLIFAATVFPEGYKLIENKNCVTSSHTTLSRDVSEFVAVFFLYFHGSGWYGDDRIPT